MEPVTLSNILAPNIQLSAQNKTYKEKAIELSLASVTQSEIALSQTISNRLQSFSRRQSNLTKKLECIKEYLENVADGSEIRKGDKFSINKEKMNFCSYFVTLYED